MREETTIGPDDVAVTEAVSYILIFGLMIVGTALIYLQAGPSLTNAEENQVDRNAERVMRLMQDTVSDMVVQDAPRRQTSAVLNDLTIAVGGELNESRYNITVRNTSGDVVLNESYNSTPVYIQTPIKTIAYENGALFMGEIGTPDSWSMTSYPSWTVSTNSTDYPTNFFVRSVPVLGNGKVVGNGRVRVLFESTGSINENVNDIAEMNITVESERAGAWAGFFEAINESINGSTAGLSGSTASLNITEFNGTRSVVYDETRLRAEVEG